MKDHVQKQEAGDGSTNLQGQSIVIHQGISYSDAKEIALDVYRANFLQLGADAANLARSRAEELTEDFLSKLAKEKEEAMGSMRDPGMQSAIYEAQKQYAKTGDKDLEQLLVDILVQRAQTPERNLRQIALDEALVVAAKLTAEQLDALTINFLLSKTRNNGLVNLSSISKYFERDILPFLGTQTASSLCFEHLQYAGCGSIYEVSNIHPIENLFLMNYPGLFSKGFTKEQFEEKVGPVADYSSLLMPSFRDANKLQFKVVDESVLEKMSESNGLSDEAKQKIKGIFTESKMTEPEVRNHLSELSPAAKQLIELWGKSGISKFTLTPVGIAVAQANFCRRTGQKLDLSIWI